ncbi:hypothetical protein FHETE_2689 [Fusarium heterosporum]|uniref:Mid2 domain-containing protein n=1 Tax=Fusarium heterosporum TaxID=42747 RepID=A0A8H5TSZ9_FUSHE|nr:hypothetical protein FHETE_2689 [Fusarium heterosporum]
MKHLVILQLLFICQGCTSIGLAFNAPFPAVTNVPFPTRPSNHIEQRAISTELSTCGYLNGDPSKERTADSGFNCRVDTKNGLWGFCPTTVLTASDCGLAGGCIDSHACSDGCGMTDSKDLTTFTCGRKSFCSMALLTFGVDQTYSYIACGTKAATDHYQITPTLGVTSTSESIEPTTSQIKTKTSSAISTQTSSSTTETAQSASAEASNTSSKEDTPANPSTNIGAIIGGVIGGLVVICGTVIVAILLLRRNRRRDAKHDTQWLNMTKDSSPQIWVQSNTKEPQELGGRNIHEMPVYGTSDRHSPIELAA